MKSNLKKKVATSMLFVAVLVGFSSCSKDEEKNLDGKNLLSAKSSLAVDACGCTRPYASTITLPQIISANTTLSCDNLYLVSGKVYVTNGATLTISAGTRIEGIYNSDPVAASAIVVTRGSKISAIGTATCPIVMTAHIDATNATANKGDWGGLVLLGKAVINSGTAAIEGISSTTAPAGVDINYGGTDNADNSGTLSYVRVEYAGASIAADNELNAFTFGGVGAGTTLNHLQAYKGADDSFEFFGGNVNAKYLISTYADDDAFDFDLGYTGKLQFLVSVIDPNGTYSANANGIESDNNATGTTATPFTHPTISNLTIAGTSNGNGGASGTVLYGAHFRRNTRFALRNSIIYGYKTSVFLDANVAAALSNTLTDSSVNTAAVFANNVLGNTTSSSPVGVWSNTAVWTPSSTTNGLVGDDSMELSDPYVYSSFFTSAQALVPTAAPASSGADFTGLDSFFTATTYKGAVSASSYWITESWVNTVFP